MSKPLVDPMSLKVGDDVVIELPGCLGDYEARVIRTFADRGPHLRLLREGGRYLDEVHPVLEPGDYIPLKRRG